MLINLVCENVIERNALRSIVLTFVNNSIVEEFNNDRFNYFHFNHRHIDIKLFHIKDKKAYYVKEKSATFKLKTSKLNSRQYLERLISIKTILEDTFEEVIS